MAKLEIVKRLESRIRELNTKIESKNQNFQIEMFLKNSAFSFMVENGIFLEYEKYFKKKHQENCDKLKHNK